MVTTSCCEINTYVPGWVLTLATLIPCVTALLLTTDVSSHALQIGLQGFIKRLKHSYRLPEDHLPHCQHSQILGRLLDIGALHIQLCGKHRNCLATPECLR